MVARKCRRRRRRRVASRRRRQPERRCYSRERRQPDEGSEWTASRVIDSSVLRLRWRRLPRRSGFWDEEGEEGSPVRAWTRRRRCVVVSVGGACARARADVRREGKRAFRTAGVACTDRRAPKSERRDCTRRCVLAWGFAPANERSFFYRKLRRQAWKKLASVNIRECANGTCALLFLRGILFQFTKRGRDGKYRIYFYAIPI